MKVSDLTESERKVWEAVATGALVDLRAGDSDLDSPERGSEWASERVVRAEVIATLLIGDGEAASMAVRGVRLQGARITGNLNLEASTLRCPLALLNCSFAEDINLNEATAVSVGPSGSHVPTVRARQLRTRGDLLLDEGFSVSGRVELEIAHIEGEFSCGNGQFSNSNDPALNADGLTVDKQQTTSSYQLSNVEYLKHLQELASGNPHLEEGLQKVKSLIAKDRGSGFRGRRGSLIYQSIDGD